MAQRLVLSAKDGVLPLNELVKFATTASKYGVGMKSASYDVTDGELKIMVTLPKDVRVVGNRSIKVKPKNKKQQAVDKQIQDHAEKKKNGEATPYVPPVGKKTAPKPQKVKCLVCNVRKPIQKVNGVRIVKPHVSKGEPCPGGGEQVKK